MILASGRRLGPYEVQGPLGAGGMGEVFRARDTRLDRDVAIKVLPMELRADREARARFRREALALSRLNHPNVEMVLDFGEHDGIELMVLEFVPGETLADRLARGRIPEREAAEIGSQVAEALAEAHEHGVLHRDLKPGNVMVTPKGRVKVLDFGLARIARPENDDTRSMAVTEVGVMAGTLAYMSPEHLLGQPVDGRTDLYALGVVLYEMTTGRRPFQAPVATALANEILHAAVVPPRSHESQLSARAEAIILRAMERDIAHRYQTASEMQGELQRLVAIDPESHAVELPDPSSRRVTSIAVLPLENLSGDPAQEYFSDGMTEELIASLAQVRALRIIPRTSMMRYKGQRRPIPEIARELNVDAVVEGSVRRAGQRVRINAQLIEAATERHLWAKSYERDLEEVLALQGEVAAAIVQEIQVTVTPQEATKLRDARAVLPEAYEAHLKGRHLIERRTEDALREALANFQEALRLDPGMVAAHVGVAEALNLMGFMTVIAPREAFPPAQAAARRALALQPHSGEAVCSIAYAVLWHDWNFAEAERLFLKAIELNPRYSIARVWYANVLALSNRVEEADAQVQVARSLDPLSNIAMAFRGTFLYWRGRFDEAIERFVPAMKLIPDFAPPYYWIGLTYTCAGRIEEALDAIERFIDLVGRTPPSIAALACAHAVAGRVEETRTLLAELDQLSTRRYVAAYYFAKVHAALGERDPAMAALERAYEERVHWLVQIHIDPALDPLRGDSRFEALRERILQGQVQ